MQSAAKVCRELGRLGIYSGRSRSAALGLAA